MKLLVPFVLLFALLGTIYANTILPDNPYLNKYLELVRSEKPSTDAGRHSIGCFAWYCHFEDKDGCRKECNKYVELIVKIEDRPATEDEYVGSDAKLCAAYCMKFAKAGLESEKVCANLCRMETSHPDREKWVPHFKEMTALLAAQFKEGTSKTK